MTTHTTGQTRSCHHYPNRVLQKRDLATELGGVCEKTVDNLVKAGLLPQPCWLNSIPVWMLHDVHAFISNRSGVARLAGEPAPKDPGSAKRASAATKTSKAGKWDV
jgi:hypothetical protein